MDNKSSSMSEPESRRKIIVSTPQVPVIIKKLRELYRDICNGCMFDLDITEEKSLLKLNAFTESVCGGIYETCIAYYDYLGYKMEGAGGTEYLKKYIELKRGSEKDNLVFDVNSAFTDKNEEEAFEYLNPVHISKEVEPVIKALVTNSYFKGITFSGYRIEAASKVVDAIAYTMAQNKSVCKLILRECSQVNKVLSSMSLNAYNSVQYLDISNSKPGSNGVESLKFWLASMTHGLNTLKLSKCGLGHKDLTGIFLSLRSNFGMSLRLQHLDLSHNCFKIEGTNAFVQWLLDCDNKSLLECIRIVNCSLDMGNFLRALRKLRFLSELDVRDNVFDGDENTIKEMYFLMFLKRVGITGAGNKHPEANIVLALKNLERNIRIKNDCYVRLNNVCLSTIVLGVERGANITSLDLVGCSFSDDNLVKLINHVSCWVNLKNLVLDECRRPRGTFGKDLSRKISKAFELYLSHSECKLERLSLSKSFGRHIIAQLMEDMVVNKSVEYLDISHNDAGVEVGSLLCTLMRSNKVLREIRIDGNYLDTQSWIAFRVEIDKCVSMKHMDSPIRDFHKIQHSNSADSTNYKNAVNSVFTIMRKHPEFEEHLFNVENDQVNDELVYQPIALVPEEKLENIQEIQRQCKDQVIPDKALIPAKIESQVPTVSALPTDAEVAAMEQADTRKKSILHDLKLTEEESSMFSTFNLDDFKQDILDAEERGYIDESNNNSTNLSDIDANMLSRVTIESTNTNNTSATSVAD